MTERRSSRALWLALFMVLGACGESPMDAVELMPTTLPQGLVAYWAFDEGQGTTLTDLSGNRRDGVLTGGTWLVDGRFGGALELGDSEFVTVAAFPDATPSWSVSAWVRIHTYTQSTSEDTHWATIVSTEASGGWELGIDQFIPSPGLHFGYWIGPDTSNYAGETCPCLELGQWTQLTAVVDGSRMVFEIYVDGQLRMTKPAPQLILPGSPILYIGRMPGYGRWLLGDVDDIAIWDRVLVPTEVEMLFQHPPVAPP